MISNQIVLSFVENFKEVTKNGTVVLDTPFIHNFSGPKRIKKKKAKRAISDIFSQIIIPHAKEVIEQNKRKDNE